MSLARHCPQDRTYKASMPMTPSAPARPAPTTAVGYEAPPVDEAVEEASPSPSLVRDAERVGERTVETVVELRMLVRPPVPLAPVSVTTGVCAGEVTGGVVVTAVAAGKREGRALFTSVGSAAYQDGVLPAESEDWSWDTRASGLEKANCWMDDGMAVARTPRMDWKALQMSVSKQG
jgi:hypothetical protein